MGNRSAAIRIPKYASQPDTARFEFRPPDATCNVYLALAAQLLAGLDGIQRQIKVLPCDASLPFRFGQVLFSSQPLRGNAHDADE